MTTYRVGVIVGSISANSINRRLATALERLSGQAGLELTEIPIRDLPLFDHDLEPDYPATARDLKAAIAAADAVLLVTPEYNRSVPGVLKNALDWASRPKGTSPLAGKPSAVIGTSPGQVGTAVAQQHLRSILSFLNSPELAQPEAYVRTTPGLITDDGEVTDPGTADFLARWLRAFRDHIARELRPLG
ncbi:MAG TPA: NADPH-dependent FMN reductase [Cellulomonas sp.]